MKSAKRVRLNKFTHSVRASQAVLQYGVGAMVDFPDQTLMTAAPEYWAERIIKFEDDRLQKVLRVNYLGMPGGKDEERFQEGISYARFPEWYFCPKCRKFQPLSKWVEEYKRKASAKIQDKDPDMVEHMQCQTCRQDLVVARVLVACKHGHIDDFPWVKWVHYRNVGGKKTVCEHPSLKFKTGASSTESLEGLIVTCEYCHARATLKDAFNPEIFQEFDKKEQKSDFICTGRHPWKNIKEVCNQYPRAIQRGSSSVYYPVTVSSLTIPPFSDLLNTKINESSAFQEVRTAISCMAGMPQEMKDSFIQIQLPQWAKRIAKEISAKEDVVCEVLKRKWCNVVEEEYTTQSVKYRGEEYEALNGTAGIGSSVSRDFSRESMDTTLYDIPYIKNISLIHKIREVQALTGFSRLNPVEWSGQSQCPEGFVPIKEKTTDWYPAYEVRGEGIFIELDQDIIKQWASDNKRVQKRVDNLNNSYAGSFFGQNYPRQINAKFVMLHTLAHLLIKQLSFECGYSIASLKERIYCSEAVDGKEMAGILIYTASGDSEGTLGGLVRQGRPDCLTKIFRKALEGALTCSNDPVCSLSDGQGRDSLNLAACYSCTLIPETSCEEYNVFLDRGVLVGTFKDHTMGLFSSFVYGEELLRKKSNEENSGASKDVSDNVYDAVLVQHNGTKLSNMVLSDVWKYVLDGVSEPSKTEKELFAGLCSASYNGNVAEDPLSGERVKLVNSRETIDTDLVWENARVMIFLSDNKDNYLRAKKSDWTCFYTDDPNLTANDILTAIKGEC